MCCFLAVPPSSLPVDSSKMGRTDSTETPPTPLYDEDQTLPLEPFPRSVHPGHGWTMQLRQPSKKKLTGQRFVEVNAQAQNINSSPVEILSVGYTYDHNSKTLFILIYLRTFR